ncbi:hypothetical protein ACHAWF_010903 [Thalassiosira exigua]
MILSSMLPILWQFVPYWPVLLLFALASVYLWLSHWPGRDAKVTPIRASPFSPEQVPENLDTIVIGSGSGGSSCSNILAQSGQRVLLLEQHEERTGGCTHTFRMEGCEWDTGLHYTSEGMGLATHRAGALLKFMTRGKQEWERLYVESAFAFVRWAVDSSTLCASHFCCAAASPPMSRDDPYDQVFFPPDANVAEGRPNERKYDFNSGAENVVDALIERIDPCNSDLRKQCEIWMELATVINEGFTALGKCDRWTRIIPSFLHFFLRTRVNRLYKLASYSVRDVQYAIFNKGEVIAPGACTAFQRSINGVNLSAGLRVLFGCRVAGYSIEQLLRDCPKAPPGPEPDPVLRRVKAVLNHPIGDYAVQPRVATFAAQGITMAHYMDGAAYTVGPTQNISIRMSSMLRNFGGDVLCDATVDQIVVENGRAVGVLVHNTSRGSDGPKTEIRARNIVCATSVFNLHHKLLPPEHPSVKDFFDPDQRTIKESNGHVFLFCKIKGNAKELELPTHNLWYFNSYDMDESFDKYYADPVAHRPPTVYIGFPCTKDPTWPKRLPGISNCILISDGLYDWFKKWHGTSVHSRGEDYEEFKGQLAKHLLDILYETVPQAKGKASQSGFLS